MKTYITSLFMITVVWFTGCNPERHAPGDKHEHTAGEGHDQSTEAGCNRGEAEAVHPDEILFTKEQARMVGLTTETVSYGTFRQVIKTSGQIQAAQGDETVIVATSNGVVSFVNPSLADGAAVRKGDAIVTVSARKLSDGDPAVKARIEYETALRDYQRAEQLVKDRIISVKDFEQATLRYETARTVYEAQAEDFTPEGVRVTSPLTGYIINKRVAQGEYVSTGQPIATVARNKRLQLRAEVPEIYYKELKHISSAHFKPAYDEVVYKLSDLNGRLLSFGRSSDGPSFYLPVTFEFDNAGDFIPGSFTEVFLLTQAQERVISVPISSVTEEQGLHFVYLQSAEEAYKKQEVSLGHSNGERVRILSGLASGDKVVTQGVYQVKLAAFSSVMPDGHSH